MKDNLKLVPFNPTKKRHVELGELAKAIIEREKSDAISLQQKFELNRKNMLLRRLYHIGYGTSKMYSFPIKINEHLYSDDKGHYTLGRKMREVNPVKAFANLKTFFNSQGFSTKVYKQKHKGYDDKPYLKLYLEIKGIKGK